MRYNLSASSSLVSFSPSSVNVGAHDTREVKVTASLSRAAMAALPSADQFLTGAFGELTSMSGAITATPATTGPGLYPLRVAYLLVPRGLSNVQTTYVRKPNKPGPNLNAKLKVANHGVHDGAADTYALGRIDPRGDGGNGTDVRAIGVQSLPASVLTGNDDPSDRGLQFAINSYDRFSTEAPNEVDVAVDTDGDGAPNYFVVGIDDGQLFAGVIDGLYLSVVDRRDDQRHRGRLAGRRAAQRLDAHPPGARERPRPDRRRRLVHLLGCRVRLRNRDPG